MARGSPERAVAIITTPTGKESSKMKEAAHRAASLVLAIRVRGSLRRGQRRLLFGLGGFRLRRGFPLTLFENERVALAGNLAQ